jgi:hypothetical protein
MHLSLVAFMIIAFLLSSSVASASGMVSNSDTPVLAPNSASVASASMQTDSNSDTDIVVPNELTVVDDAFNAGGVCAVIVSNYKMRELKLLRGSLMLTGKDGRTLECIAVLRKTTPFSSILINSVSVLL